jgi:starch phosphorylase
MATEMRKARDVKSPDKPQHRTKLELQADFRNLKRQGSKTKLYRYPSQGNISFENLRRSFSGEKLETKPADQKGDQSLLWKLMATYIDKDVATIQRQISDHVEYTLACDRHHFSTLNAYQATAYSVRDRLIEYCNDSQTRFTEENTKRVYYLSIEYLLGRSLLNSLLNMSLEEDYRTALTQLGYQLEDLCEEEVDAGLGNGGLGRLAACYLDSLATCNYAAWGYGIRYNYGMFKQSIFQGWQAEIPDLWLKGGNPWEILRNDRRFVVRFYGEAKAYTDADGKIHTSWDGGDTILAIAYDTPIPGYNTPNTLSLRLWKSEPTSEFDLGSFNEGNYFKAIEKRQQAETISSVLYPADNTDEGKVLRLKQQYFFCSATIQDIVRRFKKRNTDWKTFPEKAAIQLNDTHPTISVPELMRILLDVEGFEWEEAEAITKATFAYTNHTVMPEALERWSVPLFQHLLPRHLQIIYEINHRFMVYLSGKYPGNDGIMSRLSIIQEGNPKYVRMANLAIIMSHKVNGVAALHTEILSKTYSGNSTKSFQESLSTLQMALLQEDGC